MNALLDRTVPRLPGARSIAIALAVLALAACGDDAAAPAISPVVAQRIAVTSELGSQESELIASIYAQALENAGFRVARKNPSGDRDALYDAVSNGTVQLVPQYTGELLASVLERTGSGPVKGDGPVQQQAAIASLLPANLKVGSSTLALHNDVVACSSAATKEHSLTTLASLATVADQITIGAPAGFETSTPLGLARLEEIYGAKFAAYVPLTPEQMDDAVKNGDVDCIAVSSVSPTIAAQGMTILDDILFAVPSQAVIPLLAADAATPEVLAVIDALSLRLTTVALNQMMSEISTNGTSPDLVAKAFLQSAG